MYLTNKPISTSQTQTQTQTNTISVKHYLVHNQQNGATRRDSSHKVRMQGRNMSNRSIIGLSKASKNNPKIIKKMFMDSQARRF